MKRICKLTVLTFTIFSFGAYASGFCPKERPKQNGVLLYASCSQLEQEGESALKPWEDMDFGSKEIDAFATDEICVCYAYKDSKVGETAINITSIRYFVRAHQDLIDVTTLYRNNAFFDRDGRSAGKHLDEFENKKYDKFHKDYKVSTRELMNEFHAYIDKNGKESTYSPKDRRYMFAFLGTDNNGRDKLRRSYLIGFTGNQYGTWVPFIIGTGANGENGKYLTRVDLKIADLHVPGLKGERIYSMKQAGER
ncbi:hypothetical protein D0814_23755 [Vibrio parahaemolyticus]|nr:hypothetical protein [Vibrio parahaemolyticus]EHH1260230.1 hypothetical protein [Vibrio parahaemolyticus]